MDTVAWGWPVLEVNTNQTVDRAEPLAFVRSWLAKPPSHDVRTRTG
jgi:hypothetical protein